VESTPSSPTRGWWPGLPLLLAAVSAGVVAQGGFHPAGRIVVAVMALAAMVASRPSSWADSRSVLWIAAALSMWVIVRTAMNESVIEAVPVVVTLAGLLAAFLVVRCADAAGRQWCAEALVGVGVLVGVSGWIGVAWRWPPLALPTGGLWRATSTLTYANAAAALLASLSLLAIAMLVAREPSLLWASAVHLLLVGLGATLSRGGLLAFMVGLVVLSGLAGVRLVVWRTAPAFLGAAVTLGALVPFTSSTASARPMVAVAGRAVGAAITMVLTRFRGKRRAGGLLVGVALGAGAATLLPSTTLQFLLERRVTFDSFGRVDAARAAIDLIAIQPWTGVGPGQARLVWTTVDGRELFQRYAHNEYLQILVELGAVGLTLLLALLVAIATTVRRGRTRAELPHVWMGAVAALVALAIHSGFDFLWHLPVIPLCAGLFAGLAAPARAGAAHSAGRADTAARSSTPTPATAEEAPNVRTAQASVTRETA
jgi:hypothetical protein